MDLIPKLTSWKMKQAAMLYFFASDEYLTGLQTRVYELQSFVDGLLNTSRAEGRDRFIRNSRWGERDTSQNWSNHAWSFLADFGLSVARDIADRRSEIFHETGAYQCGRGMAEFSMDWATPDEEEQFDAMFSAISKYADYIDRTMNKSHRAGRWNDFGLTLAWEKHCTQLFPLPKFRVREDCRCITGEVPPKTGVYISTDFPEASLQFAWNGNEYGKLRQCSIFNDLGLQALAFVGRPKLWLDENAMLDFVVRNIESPDLKQDPFYTDSIKPELAPSLVARNAFTSAPTTWCYVELLPGEFEQLNDDQDISRATELRIEAGKHCGITGYYFTPASLNSRRYFNKGDIFPDFDSTYGKTIWQWDEKQD